jgi:hypothetical protein
MTMSTSWEPLPSIYRSKQEFLASLPRWRRLLQMLNWHPTIDKKVQRYALEQRILQEKKAIEQLKSESLRVRSETEQLKKENARLAASNARLERFEREHWSGLTPHPSTGDSWSS